MADNLSQVTRRTLAPPDDGGACPARGDGSWLAGVADTVSVRVRLVGVPDGGAVVAEVPPAVAVTVLLAGIDRERAIIRDVHDPVMVGVGEAGGTGPASRSGSAAGLLPEGTLAAGVHSRGQVVEGRAERP